MAFVGRLLRWILLLGVGAAVLVLLLVALVLGLLRSGLVHDSLDRWITALARKDGAFFLRVENVSGALPNHLRVGKVEIGDGLGVWMTIEDAELWWRPFDTARLFDPVKWRIPVSRVHAARLEWTRLPEEDDDDDEPFRWDRFPRILIDELRIDDFEISGPILDGAKARFRAEGSAVLGEWHHGRVDLRLEHRDGIEGRAHVHLETGGSPLELRGRVTAEEAAGGALAALARLGEVGAVRLDVRAEGPLADWKAEADVDVETIGRLRVEATLAFDADAPFEVRGSFDPVAAQRDRYLVGTGAPLALHVQGRFAPEVELRLDRVLLSADGRELRADGRLDLESKAFTVAASVAHERRGEAVDLDALSLVGATLEGSGRLVDAGSIDAKLSVEGLAIDDLEAGELTVTLRASDGPGDSGGTFTLDASASGLALEGTTIPLVGRTATLASTGRFDLDAGTVATDAVQLAARHLRVEGPLTISDAWSRVQASLKAEAESLETLTRLAGTAVEGRASLSLELDTGGERGALEVQVKGEAADLEIGEAGWNAVFGPAVTLEGDFSGDPTGPATASLRIVAAGFDADAKGSIGADGSDLVADANVRFDNLAGLSRPAQAAIAGRATLAATLRGSLDDFALDATASADRFAWNDFRVDRLAGGLRASGLPGAWQGEADVAMRYDDRSASVAASVAMPDSGRLVVQGLTLAGPRTNGRADLDIDFATGRVAGELQLDARDLRLWRPFLGVRLGGSVDVDLRFAAPGAESQVVSGRASVKNLDLPFGETPLLAASVDLAAEDLHIGATPAGSATMRASEVQFGDTRLDDAEGTLAADGSGERSVWKLDFGGDLKAGAAWRVDASALVRSWYPGDIVFTRLDLKTAGTGLELLEPALLRFEDASWSVEPLVLGFPGDGSLRGRVLAAPTGVLMEADLKDVPLALLSAFADLDFTGSLGGRVRVAGADFGTARGEILLQTSGMASALLVEDGVTPVDARLDATLGAGRVQASATLVGLTDTRFVATADAPLFPPGPSDRFAFTLRWQGDLAEAMSLVPLGEDAVRGRIDADLRLEGTPAAPRVHGSARVSGASWENAAAGLVLTDIEALLEGEGPALFLRSLTARDGGQGTVGARGALRFEDVPGFDLDLDLEAAAATLVRLDVATVRADANVAVRASRSAAGGGIGGTVSGSVKIDEARIRIPQSFDTPIPEIEVVEVGASDDDASDEEDDSDAPSGLDLDLSVRGDNRIFVAGRGLESEWKANLAVRGTTEDPRVEGVVESVRGQLELLGRRFDLRKASLRFDGAAGNIPYLALQAEASAHDITALVDIRGPALQPKVELSSEPALPSDEVLSRVLFGESAGSLTPIQSVELARSVAELAGSRLAGGPGILGRFGQTLGLDRLAVDSSGADGGAALSASKYLTDNVYLRVQQGLTPDSTKLSIEWEIWKNITIESDVSPDAQGEVGVNWRWDY